MPSPTALASLQLASLEQTLITKLRQLPSDCQQQIIDLVDFLWEQQTNPLPETLPSLPEIATLPLSQRYALLMPYMAATAEDFAQDPDLTEFADLDTEDWETFPE